MQAQPACTLTRSIASDSAWQNCRLVKGLSKIVTCTLMLERLLSRVSRALLLKIMYQLAHDSLSQNFTCASRCKLQSLLQKNEPCWTDSWLSKGKGPRVHMLAVENDCCWVATFAAPAFVLQPSSINAKLFSICFHIVCSNNSTHMEIITDHLSAKGKEACWARTVSVTCVNSPA